MIGRSRAQLSPTAVPTAKHAVFECDVADSRWRRFYSVSGTRAQRESPLTAL